MAHERNDQRNSGYLDFILLKRVLSVSDPFGVIVAFAFFQKKKRGKTSYCIFGDPACAIFLSPECGNYTEMYWQ